MSNSEVTRRKLISGLFALPSMSIADTASLNTLSDNALVALGKEFDQFACALDRLVQQPRNGYEQRNEIDYVLTGLDRLETEILRTPATTFEGLQVKAKIFRWSRGDDLYPRAQVCLDTKMLYSVIRDLLATGVDSKA